MGEFTIEYGDIVDDKFLNWCDIIGCPINPPSSFDDGVCGAIFKKAGRQMLLENVKRLYGISLDVDDHAVAPMDSIITAGFNLPCDIALTQCPKQIYESVQLEMLYESLIYNAAYYDYKHVLLPAIGEDNCALGYNEIVNIIVGVLSRIVGDSEYVGYDGLFGDFSNIDVKLVLPDEKTANLYKSFL